MAATQRLSMSNISIFKKTTKNIAVINYLRIIIIIIIIYEKIKMF